MQEGIIIKNISNLYKVEVKDKVYACEARGKFKKDGIIPVVGDRVSITLLNEEKGIVEEVDEEYRTTLINFAKYKLVMFTMAKIMEMEQIQRNKVILFLFNSVK